MNGTEIWSIDGIVDDSLRFRASRYVQFHLDHQEIEIFRVLFFAKTRAIFTILEFLEL